MTQIYALRVATKDRPRIFKAVVYSLFSLSICTVAVSSFYLLRSEEQPAAQTQPRNTDSRLAQRPVVYASSPALFREQK